MKGSETPKRNRPIRKTLEAYRVVPAIGAVLLLCAILASFDLVLVRVASQHRTESGVQFFEAAQTAKQAGKTAEALELFRSALNYRPGNPEYHLAFVQALEATGRTREARAALEQLLNRHPAYGAANVEMARSLAAMDWQRAAWFYRRALYGEWEGSPDLRPLRFELADLLARNDAREELVSEVVLLNAEPAQPGEAKHLARLQLAAGEWTRAERLYRELLRRAPADEELIAGLARAQLGLGRYAAAEKGLRRALASGVGDRTVERDLALVAKLNAMDPAVRGLPPSEKHRRAHEFAVLLLNVLRQCSPDPQLVQESERSLAAHEATRRPLQAAEDDLAMIDRLWAARENVCGNDSDVPRELEMLAAHLIRS